MMLTTNNRRVQYTFSDLKLWPESERAAVGRSDHCRTQMGKAPTAQTEHLPDPGPGGRH